MRLHMLLGFAGILAAGAMIGCLSVVAWLHDGLVLCRCRLRMLPASENWRLGALRRLPPRHSRVWCAWRGRRGAARRYFGSFLEQDDAARAYDKAALVWKGPSAVLNFPAR